MITEFLDPNIDIEQILTESSNFARVGLRTLVFAHRLLSRSEFDTFMTRHNDHNDPQAMSLIECDMDFQGEIVQTNPRIDCCGGSPARRRGQYNSEH